MDPGLKSSNSNNRVARASAAARGVSFIFGRFFGRKLENPVFCMVFANNTMFRCFRFPLFFLGFCQPCFFGKVFAKVSQVSCFSSWLFVDF